MRFHSGASDALIHASPSQATHRSTETVYCARDLEELRSRESNQQTRTSRTQWRKSILRKHPTLMDCGTVARSPSCLDKGTTSTPTRVDQGEKLDTFQPGLPQTTSLLPRTD